MTVPHLGKWYLSATYGGNHSIQNIIAAKKFCIERILPNNLDLIRKLAFDKRVHLNGETSVVWSIYLYVCCSEFLQRNEKLF
jgi:hypothetical protein